MFTEDATAWGHSKSSGWRNFSSHIKAEFSISLQFPQSGAGSGVVTLVTEVTALLDIILHSLQPVRCGLPLSSHGFENSGLSQMWKPAGVEKMKEKKVFGYGDCVCVAVEEILTYVTFVSSNREDFQTVIWWCTKMDWAATAVRILVDFSSHMGM